ncbi:MAG TPA: histidine phosphatase family protein [Patescibacteria group bacterium]|nr:histidine phosphatase family protein [Patescibacteria group bacterium]
MFLFLVRHAEADGVKDRWQAPNSKLSKLGEQQAGALANQLKSFKIDQIFSSDLERSTQTADIISKKIGVETSILDYICERQQLDEMYGAQRESNISKKYIEESRHNFNNLDWKFEDKEESVREVINRTMELTSFLTKNFQGKRVAIVSHDLFIRCLISRILLGKDYSDTQMARSINTLTIDNTGLSLLIHSSQFQMWKINYINNYSHFKDIRINNRQ